MWKSQVSMYTCEPFSSCGHYNDHDNDSDVDNDDNEESGRKRAAFEPKYSRRWRRRQHICRAAGERLVIPVSGHAGERLNTYVWPMKLFLVAYRWSRVYLSIRVVMCFSAYILFSLISLIFVSAFTFVALRRSGDRVSRGRSCRGQYRFSVVLQLIFRSSETSQKLKNSWVLTSATHSSLLILLPHKT